MMVYVVLGLEMYGIDRSTDAGVFKTFRKEKDAKAYAKELYEDVKFKNTDYSMTTEEFDENGSYCMTVGRGDDFYFFNVWVEASELK